MCWTPRPVGKGGMRDCFLVWEMDGDGQPTQMIGKVFQADVKATMEDYMNECITQCVSDTFAQMYNRQGVQHKVSFLGCYLVRLSRSGPNGEKTVFTMEPMLRGIYEKHNNNVGQVFTQNHTAEAFTHFTFLQSEHKLLVCDLQGVGGMYTDPQIHTLKGDDYGLGNLGKDGIRKWMAGHKCGPLCIAMGFPPIKPSAPEPPKPAAAPAQQQLAQALPHLFNYHRHAQEMRATFRKQYGGTDAPLVGLPPHMVAAAAAASSAPPAAAARPHPGAVPPPQAAPPAHQPLVGARHGYAGGPAASAAPLHYAHPHHQHRGPPPNAAAMHHHGVRAGPAASGVPPPGRAGAGAVPAARLSAAEREKHELERVLQESLRVK